jgi:hypothetical protein
MDAKQQADSINAALADDIPQIEQAPSTIVELMRGIFNKETNSWETTAVVRELNGFDEEALAALDSKNLVYAEYMSTLLKRAVLSIGDTPVKENPSMIDNLIIGDRDLLFLGVVEATYGKIREYVVPCGTCNASNDVNVSLDEFERKTVDFDLQAPIMAELTDGTILNFRLPTGSDSQAVAKRAKTTAEQNTLMLARCLEEPSIKNAMDWSKGLSLRDRTNILRQLLDNQPGPQIGEVEAQCATCGDDLKLVLDWASLLFG